MLQAHIAQVRTQHILDETLMQQGLTLDVRREDELHPHVSGNKFRKLKYNIEHALTDGYQNVITFGGAYSNHIAATSYACKLAGLPCVGIIRGHELADKWHNNPTLMLAHEHGMQFEFVTREQYRQKSTQAYTAQLLAKYPHSFLVPEGGTNELAVQGCSEIISKEDVQNYDVIVCAVGTGGTLAGIINACKGTNTHVLGISSIKAESLIDDIQQLTHTSTNTKADRNTNYGITGTQGWQLNFDYTFGGYAKHTPELWQFIDDMNSKHSLPLEPIYTAKMMYAIFDLIQNQKFTMGSKILAIHTGGLQGLQGFKR